LGLCAITQNETGLEIVQSSPSYTFAQLRARQGRRGKPGDLVFAQLRKARQTWESEESGACAIAQGEADLGKRGVWCLRNCARVRQTWENEESGACVIAQDNIDLENRGSLISAQLRKATPAPFT
jgi:hypothetical protein